MTQHSVSPAYIDRVARWQHPQARRANALAVSWGVLERPALPGPR